MKPLSLRVLQLFGEMEKDQLDLHALFEAAGNESTERRGVPDAIDELTRAGLLDECGSDFFALTEKGKDAIAQSWLEGNAACFDTSESVRRDRDGSGGGQR